MNLPPFVYSPLRGQRSIRVLQLNLIDPADNTIRAHLSEKSFDTCGKYEALSYTWNSEKLSVPLVCNGALLWITENCNDALKRLLRYQRKKVGKKRWFWVDAICINQQSVPEKNHQVRMMSEIYFRASQVHVWLGSGTAETDEMLKQIKRLALLQAVLKVLPRATSDLGKGIFDKQLARLEKYEAGSDVAMSKGVACIFRCSWFTRMWVVQEMAMSCMRPVKLHCGEKMIRYDSLFRAADNINSDANSALRSMWYMHMKMMDNLRKVIVAKTEGKPLPYPVNMSRIIEIINYKQSTDPRDKIFGLFGLFKYLGWSLPEPNYKLSVERVYADFTTAAIKHDRSLLLLSLVSGTQSTQSMPSWVPDFSATIQTALYENWNFTFRQGHLRSRFSHNDKYLIVAGIRLDVIIEQRLPVIYELKPNVFDNVYNDKSAKLTALHTLSDWFTFSVNCQRLSPGGAIGKKADEFVKTVFMYHLLGNKSITKIIDNERYNFCAYLQTKNSSNNFPKDYFFGYPNQEACLSHSRVRDFSLVLIYAISTNRGRSLFVDSSGSLGTAPRTIRAGDVVVLLTGCNQPAVLRKHENNEIYSFLGFAYMDKVKGSEIWDNSKGRERSELGLEEFTLA